MLKNYLTVAWRALRRDPVYSAINAGGLAIAMAACLLIGLFVRQELSVDAFHDKADRIFYVGKQSERFDSKVLWSLEPKTGMRLNERFSQVETVVHTTFPQDVAVGTGKTLRHEEETVYASEHFFDVFTFPLAQGDPERALAEPGSAVLTPQAARKYFGEGENPMGQPLTVEADGEERAFTVTGVTEPLPENTRFSFDLLLSGKTLDRSRASDETFALLRTPEAVDALRQVPPTEIVARKGETPVFVPLTNLYLSDFTSQSGFRGDPRYLYLFSAVGALILLIAAINYANLATARAARRAREVGIRKTVGATRFQVARQFFGESILLTLFALGLALLLARLAMPAFGTLLGTTLTFDLAGNGALLGGLLALVLVTGLVAGSYPALYLSGFHPTEVLRGQSGASASDGRLRRGLVAFQFAVSIGLIIGAGVVWQQLRYMQTKDLGFEPQQVVELPMGRTLEGRYETVKRALRQHPNVTGVAAASAMPGEFNVTRGVNLRDGGEKKKINVKHVPIDGDYLDVMGMRLKAGRGFSATRVADSAKAVVLNQAALDALGWRSAVGKSFGKRFGGEVVGVVENFHFVSPRKKIEPVAFTAEASYYTLAVRIRPEGVQETLAFLEEQWNRFVPEKPFEYSFLEEQFDRMYEAERRLSRTIGALAALAVLISCLGLFGLAAFAAERRKKEIAIRKTFGASTRQIVALLSKEFLALVAIGFALAVPVAWWAMGRWLEGFAYPVELSLWIFAAAGLLVLTVAMGTTSWQALRAAHTSPAQALKSE